MITGTIREVPGHLILFAAMLAWAPATPAAPQEPPIAEEVRIASCAGRCPYTLSVEVVAEVGHDEGPGVVNGLSNAVMDSSGRVYVGGQDRVQVFAPDGTLLSAFGRRGEGPGEMSGSGGAIAFVEDGVFVLTDIGRRVIMKFNWEGMLPDEVRMSEMGAGGLIPWGGTLAVHEANILTPERIGYPLHLVNFATGEVEASFGFPDRRVRLGARADSASSAGPWARRHRVDGSSARLLDRALESGQPASLVDAQGP